MDRLFSPLQERIDGVVFTRDQFGEEHLTNYGRIHYWKPRFVVKPLTTQDVAETVRFAKEHGLFVSTRGSAHSQSELGISKDGILLDMKSMDRIYEVDHGENLVEVQGGVVWRDLVQHLKRWDLSPRVLTNNLGVTIGGTVSMAGIGVASFKYGSQGDNVHDMEVVTGNGDIVHCSRDENPELFWSVVAGLGQSAILCKANMILRKNKKMCRNYYLLYDDIGKFMTDSEKMMDDGKWDYLESWASPCPQGIKPINGERRVFAKWFYPFHPTVEFDPGEEPNDKEMLEGLDFYDYLYTDDLPTIDFHERMVPVFELWKKAGTWDYMHPWMELVMPWDTAADYINQILPDLPPGLLIGGHILLWPAKGTVSDSKFFMRPEGDNLIGFGILPAVPQRYWDQVRPILDNGSLLGQAMGGKRYLSGYINFTEEEWRMHFGDRWPELVAAKKKYDPECLLNPGFIKYGDALKTEPAGANS